MISFKYFIGRVLLYPFFHLCFKHLIKRNFRWRALTGFCRVRRVPFALCCNTMFYAQHEDTLYWADILCATYGYFIEYDAQHDKWVWDRLGRGTSALLNA